jgi:uncharacterized protein (TIGR00369 family)
MQSDNSKLGELPPHGKAIGIELVSHGDRRCRLRLPYGEHLVGDPDTGIIHGGVITALLDNASGWAVRGDADWTPESSMATLDLRIDYMRSAVPNMDLIADAECYKITRSVAFVRAIAHQGDKEDLVASSVASFMLATVNVPLP